MPSRSSTSAATRRWWRGARPGTHGCVPSSCCPMPWTPAATPTYPRSADDIHIIYTGGTTGMPKGVMWRHEDFWRVLGGGIDFSTGRRLSEYDQSEHAGEHGQSTFALSPSS